MSASTHNSSVHRQTVAVERRVPDAVLLRLCRRLLYGDTRRTVHDIHTISASRYAAIYDSTMQNSITATVVNQSTVGINHNCLSIDNISSYDV